MNNEQIKSEEGIIADFVGYSILIKVFNGEPDKWIKWLREKGSEEQILSDLPFVIYVKEQSKQDSDFLNRVRKMVEEETGKE